MSKMNQQTQLSQSPSGIIQGSQNSIRLYVTIEKLLYREALIYQLLQQPEVNLVGESTTGVDTLNQLNQCSPSVLIIEENLPDNDGLTISELALEEQPALSILLLVDTNISQSRLAIYLESGIKSVVSKNQPVTELIKSLHYIKSGQIYVDAEQFRFPRQSISVNLDMFYSLSHREQEVAQLMADRITVNHIAARLGLSNKTVHTYKERILVKMGFERLPELMLFMKRFQNQVKL